MDGTGGLGHRRRLQRQGFASEAARALVKWLQRRGAASVVANIHPDHRASAVVAIRAGLRPTPEEVDGEQVWRATATQYRKHQRPAWRHRPKELRRDGSARALVAGASDDLSR